MELTQEWRDLAVEFIHGPGSSKQPHPNYTDEYLSLQYSSLLSDFDELETMPEIVSLIQSFLGDDGIDKIKAAGFPSIDEIDVENIPEIKD